MAKSLNKELHSKDISIKTVIYISFIIILSSTVLAIGCITYSSWLNSINDTITKTVNGLNEIIISEIEIFMTNAKRLNVANRGLLEKGIIDINNESSRDIFFVNALSSFDGKGIYSFSYGTESGQYYGARQNQDNAIEIMRNNEETGGHTWYYSLTHDKIAGKMVMDAGEFDCRTRPWYKAAKKSTGMIFSIIYKHFILDDLTISTSVPIYNEDGKLLGVLGSHINLSRINNYLKEIVKYDNADAIIVEKESGNLIANSFNMINFETTTEGVFKRLTIDQIGHEAMQQAYNEYISTGIDNYQLNYRKDKIHIKLVDYQAEGLEWVIITALPNSLLVSDIKDSIKMALILTLLAIIISLLVFFRLTKKYIEPMKSLIQTQKEFANGNLAKRATIVRNDEIGMVADSFNKMANTIYELINNLEEKVQKRTIELKSSNQSLKENTDQLQLILNSTAESIYGIDLDGNCTFINSNGVKVLGYEDQSELIGKNMHYLIHHSYENGLHRPVEECSIFKALTEKTGTNVDQEVFWKKDGSYFSVEYHSYPQLSEGGIVGAVITFLDNTERKQMEQKLFNEKEQFRTTLLSVGDAVISTDNQGLITVMNPVAEKLTGWSNSEAYGKYLEEVLVIINELTREVCENPVKQVLESGNIIEMTNHTTLIRKNKDEIPIEDSAAPIKDRKGNITGVVIVFRDFADKKEKMDKIKYLSMHDHLTGLYNRWYIEDAMNRLDTENNFPITIMVIDVNGLKLVNDAFGHKMGDQLLKVVSKTLKDVLRDEDIIGRVGGDEFLIILPETDAIQASQVKKRIISAISSKVLDSIIISVAVGYSVKTNKEQKLENIRISADNQMYKNKLAHGKTMRSQTIERVLRNINFKYDQEQIHTERVSQYCESIAIAMDLREKEILAIKTAAVLHDIGKIIVPPELLNKAEKLTTEEFELIKRHPETGYQILKSVDEYSSLAEYVLYHHEHWNGRGYPQGLKGEEIPINSRIIAVADAYEAMTAERVYQKTKTKKEAIAELKEYSGKQFDPYIVKIFIEKVLN